MIIISLRCLLVFQYFLYFFLSPKNILLLDDIVVGAPIGIVKNKDEKTEKLYLANHLHFIIWYNNHKQVSFINHNFSHLNIYFRISLQPQLVLKKMIQ